MFGLKFVSFVFTVLYVIVLSEGRELNHLQDDNDIPQKDMFLIKEFKLDEDANRQVRELNPVNNGPVNSLLKGEATDTLNDEIMDGEDLKRYRRGVKKSAKKGGGGGKGGCKKGRK